MNDWEQHLLKVVETCRTNNEGMRLGQLLFNAIAMHDKVNYTGENYDEHFHSRLFNIYDEELATALEGWFEWVEQQRSKKDTSS